MENFQYKVILTVSSNDRETSEKISNHLCINGFRLLCHLCISPSQSNEFVL
ncbi:hypothetical protein I4U23_005772 [Adineta vaga]|nr:hypothetical protein I4U23_005772 [Adineta vaga]